MDGPHVLPKSVFNQDSSGALCQQNSPRMTGSVTSSARMHACTARNARNVSHDRPIDNQGVVAHAIHGRHHPNTKYIAVLACSICNRKLGAHVATVQSMCAKGRVQCINMPWRPSNKVLGSSSHRALTAKRMMRVCLAFQEARLLTQQWAPYRRRTGGKH